MPPGVSVIDAGGPGLNRHRIRATAPGTLVAHLPSPCSQRRQSAARSSQHHRRHRRTSCPSMSLRASTSMHASMSIHVHARVHVD
jgi:hypothetical protein